MDFPFLFRQTERWVPLRIRAGYGAGMVSDVGDAVMARSVPRATGGLPVVGHGWQLLRRPLEFVSDLRSRGDVVAFRLGTHRACLVTTPALTRKVLVGQVENIPKGVAYDKARKYFGNGVGTAEGAFHRRQRRVVQPLFASNRIASHVPSMRESAIARAAAWRDGSRLDLATEFHHMSVASAVRFLFSQKHGVDATEIAARCVPVILDRVGVEMWVWNDLLFALPTPGNRRAAKARREVYQTVTRAVAACRMDSAELDGVVAALLAARDPQTGEPLAARQIHDEVMSLLVGGSDTVPITLTWLFHMLGTHPDVARRVRVEVREVLGGRPVEYQDLATLDYLGRAVDETLRMYPPAWLLPRTTSADVELDGYRIPAGTYLFACPYVLHHDQRWFAEPETFNPDRWLPEHSATNSREAYLPFGMGIRDCVGRHFARAQVMVTAATLVSRWSFQPVPGERVRTIARGPLRLNRLPVIAGQR
jgi:cytochrome P450